LYLFYLQLAPEASEVTPRNRFKIDARYAVSNITVSSFTPVSSLYDVQIDMEISRVTLDFRYGIYDNLEIALEVPYLGYSSGYLDNFIEGVEDGIGARTPRSRERQGSYELDYSIRYNGVFLIQKKDSANGIGDIALSAKYQLLKQDSGHPLNLSLRTALKFPTADKDTFLGTAEFDYGIGLLLDRAFFDRLFVYTGANVIRIKKPDFFSVWGMDDYLYTGMFALEYFFTERFSAISQVTVNSTPYPESDTNPLDNKGYELGIGFNYTWKEKTNTSWSFGVVENITAASSPDVGFHSRLSWKF
ncbi:MAG: DUF3187 family protein, partial [Candidatus Omnitrophota bacterium]|nr:DUF3187 family protein [Candidatus Omnitrophota bacterium]